MPHTRLVQVAVLTVALSTVLPAGAAELTDVVDGLDPDNGDQFDFHVEPSIRQVFERGVISREAPCTDCDVPVTEFHRELDYRRVRTEFDVDMQLGLSRDFEFHMTLPIVISDRTTLEYASGVSERNSNIDPSDRRIADDLDPSVDDFYDGPDPDPTRRQFGTYRYFDVPDDGIRRTGLGDIVLGVAWAPFNDERRPHVATLRLAVDYLAPTGKPAEGDNTGVGRGVHELRLSLAASRRLREFAESYFEFAWSQPFAAAGGLFADDSPNSDTRAPGGRIDVQAGTEVVLYDDPESAQHYSWDLGLSFGYTLAGRDYTPLSDALSRSDCNGLTAADAGYAAAPGEPASAGGADGNAYNPDPSVAAGDAACAWVVQQPSNAIDESVDGRANWAYAHDGITDVEGYARVGGHTAFNLQFNEYVELRFGVDLEWLSPHLLTAADSGRDVDGDDIVELDPEPTDGDVERNPFYNLTLDPVGRRYRLENALDVTWHVGAAFQF